MVVLPYFVPAWQLWCCRLRIPGTASGGATGTYYLAPGGYVLRYAETVAHRAPNGIARHYDSDHFAIYHPPLVHRVLADQTAFLREQLRVGR